MGFELGPLLSAVEVVTTTTYKKQIPKPSTKYLHQTQQPIKKNVTKIQQPNKKKSTLTNHNEGKTFRIRKQMSV